jgi:hypothetical protein
MTISIAWTRTVRDCEELVFVSDSRLSGDGLTFDACPKILTLPRGDCAIAFAGYSGHAFPMMLQLDLAIDSYPPLRRGSIEISSLKRHALKVFDSMASLIKSSTQVSVIQNDDPDADFLFGGYSWVQKQFKLWSITYSAPLQRFEAHPAELAFYDEPARRFQFKRIASPRNVSSLCQVAFAGDQSPKARELLREKLSEKYPLGKNFTKIDLEPFEVVRDMLRDPLHSETIGGSPQVVKVYQYLHSAPLGVYWPDKTTGKAFIQGRPCLAYETIDRWILDPDTLVSDSPIYSRPAKEFLDSE